MQVLEVQLFGSEKGINDTIGGNDAVILRQIMPNPDDERFLALRYIDPYDDTIFNSLQMPSLLEELNRLFQEEMLESERRVLERLRSMALICQERTGRYLKFIGD